MNNRLMKWVKPFATFGLALAILAGWIFLVVRYTWAFLAQAEVLVIFLFFLLIVEVASQADPSLVASPIRNFLAKYSNRRDRVVIIVIYAIAFLVLSILSMLKENRFLLMVLLIIGAVAVSYGICLAFGSQELKERVIPHLIKKKLYNKAVDKNKLD
jgi:hypothetical protein